MHIEILASYQNTTSIGEIVAMVRRIHVDLLRFTVGTTQTKGSCAYAAYLLAATLRQFGDCRSAMVRGGDGEDGGFTTPDGVCHGHYWVEANTAAGALVLDITADQFGHEPIVILPLADAAQYRPGCQSIVDEHMRTLLEPNAGECATDQAGEVMRVLADG